MSRRSSCCWGMGRGDDEHLVFVDSCGQVAVLLDLGAVGLPLDDCLAVDLGQLHVVIAGHEVDHLSAQTFGELGDHLPLVVHVAAVADQLVQTHPAGLDERDDALANVVGGIHGRHLAGTDDVNLLGLAFADGQGEAC